MDTKEESGFSPTPLAVEVLFLVVSGLVAILFPAGLGWRVLFGAGIDLVLNLLALSAVWLVGRKIMAMTDPYPGW